METYCIFIQNNAVSKKKLWDLHSTKEHEVVKELEKEDGQSWAEDMIFYVDKRIYIQNNQNIRENILWENHESADIEHPEQYWMMEMIKRSYW